MINGYFYSDKPLFGLDIGSSSLKVMQIESDKNGSRVIGYGVVGFDNKAIVDGVIEKPEEIAKATKELFESGLIGSITTRRVALTVPTSRTYNRMMSLPPMRAKDLEAAVRLEAEQYIPVPLDDLYIDFTITRSTKKNIDVFVVAVPRRLVDSYMNYSHLVGFEVATIETSILASSRLVNQAERSDVPTILIDCGSASIDLTIFDKHPIITGTVSGGGETFTDLIARKLDISRQVAHTIKTKYGLSMSKKQKDIQEAVDPILSPLVREIKKTIRYYEDRTNSKAKIDQVITLGGGANMPGLSEFLTSELRLPVRMCDPWKHLSFEKLQPPHELEKTMYVTVAGLALIDRRDIWK